jgi:anti-sigma factor RsiW
MRLPVLNRRPLSCQELVELVTDYLEDALVPRRRRAVEAHLAACADCTAYLEQMRITIALTGQLREEDIEPEAMDELMQLFRDWKG